MHVMCPTINVLSSGTQKYYFCTCAHVNWQLVSRFFFFCFVLFWPHPTTRVLAALTLYSDSIAAVLSPPPPSSIHIGYTGQSHDNVGDGRCIFFLYNNIVISDQLKRAVRVYAFLADRLKTTLLHNILSIM